MDKLGIMYYNSQNFVPGCYMSTFESKKRLSSAEKQRRYRAKRKNDPVKEEAAKRRNLERYHANKCLVKDLTGLEHRAIKEIWRSASARKRDKTKTQDIYKTTSDS
ncbi:unnamed protein product [Diatraea saccharalis]|uniref:Uncharacterized protein n=1 Tax=Diatraea saccharalis TaxID=40085 RepID=A0A9N9WAT0_9NEOP|nr:unnamed protein product [Diatraea saccharalis]